MLSYLQINKEISSNMFLLFWINEQSNEIVEKCKLVLDFNPIIKQANLVKDFAICHYQARPKSLREWGVFYGGNYFSVKEIKSSVPYESILINEKLIEFPPNAVIIHRNCEVKIENDNAQVLPKQL
jgi:hypothetical protein